MTYSLGIDLGTTATAAALVRADGRVVMATLGDHATTVPSAVLLLDDGNLLFGEPALRRAVEEPDRLARNFKRLVGDPVPILLGRTPVAPELLHGRLLRWVVDQVATREGAWPTHIAVAHPANWSTYKLDLVRSAAQQAGVQVEAFVAEPVAAATAYAAERPLAAGAHVAVYDLGGGTFDAAVLRARGDGGFDLVGAPVGIDKLGGIDLDDAVLAHVGEHLDGALDAVDPDDLADRAAVMALRRECTAAKEALSSDTEVTVPVLLASARRPVRLTRAEFEAAVRPALEETVTAMQRAVAGAGLIPAQLDAVLLVGGSSRIPLVSQLVSAALQRPVVVDAHPKDVVALGTARVAAGALTAPVPAAAAAPVSGALADDGPGPTLAPTPIGAGRRPRWWAPAALATAVAALIAGFLLLPDDGEQGANDDTTTTTESSESTTTTTDEDDDETTTTEAGDGPASGLGPEDFAAAGITDFGDEAEAMWIPGCVTDSEAQAGLESLSDEQIEQLCTCIYEGGESQADYEFEQFLLDYYTDDGSGAPPEPMRTIATTCVFESQLPG